MTSSCKAEFVTWILRARCDTRVALTLQTRTQKGNPETDIWDENRDKHQSRTSRRMTDTVLKQVGERVRVMMIAHRACTAVRSYHFKAILWLNKTKKKREIIYWLVGFESSWGHTWGWTQRQATYCQQSWYAFFWCHLRRVWVQTHLAVGFCDYNKAEYK